MNAYWHFARHMLHYRLMLTLAVVFAFVSALSLGVGLVSLAPIMEMMLAGGGKSLLTIAEEHNAGDPWLAVPGWVMSHLPTDPFRSVVVVIIIIGLLTVFGGMNNFLHQYLSRTVATRAVADIRHRVFETVMHLPLLRVMQRGPSQLVARIVRDTADLLHGFDALTGKAVAQVTKGLAAFAAALYFDPGLTLMAVIVLPALGIVLRKLGKRIRRGSRGALAAQESLLRIATESLQGLRAVKANTAEDRAVARFDDRNREVIRQELRVRTAKAAATPIIEVLAVFAIGTLALFAAHRILSGVLTIDQFVLTFVALGLAGGSLRPLTGLVNEMQAASAPAGRLRELLADAVEEDRGVFRPNLPRHQQSLVFDEVSLIYPGTEKPAVDRISLSIPHGERVAIVGPNGSGKTTLLGLVPRLLEPTSGRVLIDGVDIATVNVRSLREQIGVVTQETVMFQGTIAENIAFGVASASREQIIRAAEQAHADHFIRQIPGGYDADILEQGASLSGGQRQRIAIARAILRDPAILILDEATSQIDAESEAHINEAIREFCRGRTSLIIAHRLSTVLNADRIVVLDEGRVVDQGTHEQLLRRCELYARLNRTQLVTADAPG
jgi:ATP-binding cassette, subfamily B, bacterial MsbA